VSVGHVRLRKAILDELSRRRATNRMGGREEGD